MFYAVYTCLYVDDVITNHTCVDGTWQGEEVTCTVEEEDDEPSADCGDTDCSTPSPGIFRIYVCSAELLGSS